MLQFFSLPGTFEHVHVRTTRRHAAMTSFTLEHILNTLIAWRRIFSSSSDESNVRNLVQIWATEFESLRQTSGIMRAPLLKDVVAYSYIYNAKAKKGLCVCNNFSITALWRFYCGKCGAFGTNSTFCGDNIGLDCWDSRQHYSVVDVCIGWREN